MDYYNCVKCDQSVPEIGGYDIVDDKVVCQDCLTQDAEGTDQCRAAKEELRMIDKRMDDGYEKIGKVLREGIHGEEIEFIQYDDILEKIYLKVKSGRVITIEIESDDPESFFNVF